MDTVITILNENGFAALTNALIVEKTQISSGALMHHYPSRQKLLIATVDYAYRKLVQFREAQLSALDPGLPRFRALIDMSWHTSRMPIGFAVNEVRIGARSDARLASAFRPVMTRVAHQYGRAMAKIAHEAGLQPTEQLQRLWIATSMTMRSLAVDAKTNANGDVASNVLIALRSLREQLISEQLGKKAAQDPRIAWKPSRRS